MNFSKIIGTYNKDNHKIFNFFGLKLKFKQNNYDYTTFIKKQLEYQKNDTLNRVARLIATANLHQKTFGGFKNKHFGETLVLLGAGPSLKYFEPIQNARYVGLNRTFLLDNVVIDYLFSIDKVGIQDYYEEFINYRPNECIKFIGDQNFGVNFQIPEYVAYRANARRYNTTMMTMWNKFTYNIESEPLGNYCTVSLQAMQFMLYTHPQKIYIAGIDCNMTKAGHFIGKSFDTSQRNENSQRNDDNSIKYWTEIKTFIETYYPDIEIISVNPVGLKGIFKDVYTKSYLEANPEIKNELGPNIEILGE